MMMSTYNVSEPLNARIQVLNRLSTEPLFWISIASVGISICATITLIVLCNYKPKRREMVYHAWAVARPAIAQPVVVSTNSFKPFPRNNPNDLSPSAALTICCGSKRRETVYCARAKAYPVVININEFTSFSRDDLKNINPPAVRRPLTRQANGKRFVPTCSRPNNLKNEKRLTQQPRVLTHGAQSWATVWV